jgi:hypothetical protein
MVPEGKYWYSRGRPPPSAFLSVNVASPDHSVVAVDCLNHPLKLANQRMGNPSLTGAFAPGAASGEPVA